MGTIILSLGWVLVIAVLVQTLLWLVSQLRQSSQQSNIHARELELMELKVKTAEGDLEEKANATKSWQGWRKFQIKAKFHEDPGKQICSVYFVPHDGKPIPSYKPGQFLTLQLNIPGQPKPAIRCYSLSDEAKEDHYRISVKRVPAPRGKPELPPGLGSNFVHDGLNVGDIIDLKAPNGGFFLEPNDPNPVVLIGGGIGLTPVYSMMASIASTGRDREVWFFYGVRNNQEHAMKEAISQLQRNHPNLRINVCYSNPTEDDVLGKDYQHAERVSVDLFKRLLPSNNYDFYMCGPPPMISSIIDGLKEWGVPDEHVHLEAFGPSSAKKTKKPTPAPEPGKACDKVTFHKSQKTVDFDPSKYDSIFECASENGVTIDSGCLAGNCGNCMTAMHTGKVKYTNDPSFDYDDGTCLVCSSIPDGDVELDA